MKTKHKHGFTQAANRLHTTGNVSEYRHRLAELDDIETQAELNAATAPDFQTISPYHPPSQDEI